MKVIIKAISIIVLAVLLIDFDLTYDENEAKKYLALTENNKSEVVLLDDSTLSNENANDHNIIEYVNDSKVPISLGIANIEIDCTGSGSSKENDELLVLNNLQFEIYFTRSKNGEKYQSLILNTDEKVFIHIIKNYVGETYPKNDVKCIYNTNT